MKKMPARSVLPLVVLAGLAGCASRTPPSGRQVRSIQFEDNGPLLSGRSDSALRNAMAHPAPGGFWPVRRAVPFREGLLEDDAQRIAVHYAHQGWFDATVERWRTEVAREATERRPSVIELTGIVATGEPYTVAAVDIEGVPEDHREKAKAFAPASESRFTLAAHDGAKARIQRHLQDSGYAYAEVDGEVRVDRTDHTVSLAYTVDAGPVCTFGETRIEGDLNIPESHVFEVLHHEQGETFSLSDLTRTRNDLYALDVFSMVKVEPVRTEDRSTVVDVVLEMQHQKPRTLGAGVGFQLQNGRQEALLSARYAHDNIAARRIGFSAEVQAGYAALGSSIVDLGSSGFRHAPVGSLTTRFSVPHLGVPRWVAVLEAGYERQLTPSFITDRPSLTLGYGGPIAEHLDLTVNYRVRFNRYTDVQIPLDQLRTRSPDLVDGRYFLTEIEPTLLYDSRDNPLSPRNGMLHRLTLTAAGRFLGGDYDYVGAQTDLRFYPTLDAGERFVLAMRGGGGVLAPFGGTERAVVPVAERLFLGGADSVRGWVQQHLGPYVCAETDCISPEDPASADNDIVPVGGTLQVFGSLELRRYGETFGAVAFADFGMVWQDRSTLSDNPLLPPTVGVGGRVFTPAGPIRLDVAARTDRSPLYRSEPVVWVHAGLGEAF
jgi:outer membrane protein assembly factor BamA